MAKQLKIVVDQKVVDDTYYVNKFIWTIEDDDHKVYKTGEADTRNQALEDARKILKKM